MAPISGAPRTCMVLIAAAASSTVLSDTIASSCGNLVWSMISTDHPSAASQIVRHALPLMFICLPLPAIAHPASRATGGERAGVRGGHNGTRSSEPPLTLTLSP